MDLGNNIRRDLHVRYVRYVSSQNTQQMYSGIMINDIPELPRIWDLIQNPIPWSRRLNFKI